MGQSVLRDRKTPFRSGAIAISIKKTTPVFYRKGIGLIFPNPASEFGPFGPCAVTQTNSETSVEVPGRVLFSL